MARYVQIASLNPFPREGNPKLSNEELFQIMLTHWETELKNVIYNSPDIIILHEACDRFGNFTNERTYEFNEYKGDRLLNYFRDVAKKFHCYIIYPYLKTLSDGTRRNCADLIDRNGEVIGSYNKNHPVDVEMTDKKIASGKDAPVFECDFGKIAIAICFDLNFRELLEKYKETKPEILFFASMYHGGFVQKNWAYEIGCYFVSSIALTDSGIISPVGELVAYSTNYSRYFTAKINLDCKVIHLDYNWEKILKIKEKYGNKVSFKDPGKVGVVLISSETDEFTIDKIIDEYDIMLAEEYFDYSMKIQNEYREGSENEKKENII